MVSLELTPEQVAVAKMARDWASREVAPRIHDLDRARRFERGFLDDMAKLQFLGICIPEAYGGAGLDYVSLGLACEELEYVDTHLRVILSVHVGLNSMTLLSWGNEDQKRRFLVPQARGERIASYGLTEPDAGSDAVGIRTTAVRKRDRYVLNGEKTWISLGDVADQFLVIAWTAGSAPSSSSGSGPGSARTPSRRSGGSWPETPADSTWATSSCPSRTGWERKARASGSPCSPSRTVATRWPPVPPA